MGLGVAALTTVAADPVVVSCEVMSFPSWQIALSGYFHPRVMSEMQ